MKRIVAKTGLKSVWFNCDLPEDFEIIASLNLNNYQSITAGQELLVIDEAQNVPGIGRILKIMIDQLHISGYWLVGHLPLIFPMS